MTQTKKRKTPARRTTRQRTSSSNPKKSHKVRSMPAWLRYLCSFGTVLFLSVAFYWFFIRPYAYRWRPCYGMKGYGVCLPSGYAVHGIDISHYQGSVDWAQLAQSHGGEFPLRFVFMKATEGGDYRDEMFDENFQAARHHGFIRGAYHYFIPRTDARKQAEFFIRTVHLEPGDLPPVLDVETIGKMSDRELQTSVRTWLELVESHYGIRPVLYTSYKFKTRYLNDSLFNTYPYWIAHYYVDSVRYEGMWNFWQHTDVGSVPGIRGHVDLDVFNGSMEELQELTIPKG